jgi:GNAT superfamily N-acetyltransferase
VSAPVIRAACPGDAQDLARLGNELARLMNTPPVYSVETFTRYAFAEPAHFEVLVAEWDDKIVGYALFEEMFNTDLCEPGIWLHDILVADRARGQGVGKRLMAAVAKAATDRKRTSLWWGVLNSNTAARRFYARLGATDDDARVMELHGAALRALAQSTSI